MSDRSYSPTRGRSYSTRSSSPHSYYSHSRSGSRGRSYSRGRHSRSYSSRRHSRSYSGRSPSPDYYRGKGYYHSRSPSPRYRSQSPKGGHEGRPDCTVFVGNLSYDTNWYDLKDFMRDAGQVVHVDIIKLSNGKSKGCGIVEYRYPEDAKRAIQMLNEVRFMGRYVYVRYLRGPKGEKDFDSVKEAPEDCRIFVRNLPPNFSWQDLKDLFRKAGRVLHTDVFNDPETRRPNGTGVVIFDNVSDTRHAISTLNGYNLHGNRIEVMQEKFKDVQADINQATTSPRSAITAGVVTPANATAAINAHTTNIPPPPPMSSVSDSHYYRSSSSSSPPPPPPPPPSTMIEQPMPPSPYQNVHRFGEPVPPPPPVYPGVSLVGGPAADLPTHGHNQIYVNNLPFSTTWQDLIDLFRHVGPVMRAEILVINGYPKGAGYVRFEDAETCQRAIDRFNGYIYGGRALDIKMDKYSTTL